MSILLNIFLFLVIISAIFLIIIVLLQANQGSDIGLFGGSAEMVFGSQQASMITRITAILATLMIGGSLLIGFFQVLQNKNNDIVDPLNTSQGFVLEEKDDTNPLLKAKTDSKNESTDSAKKENKKEEVALQNPPANEDKTVDSTEKAS